MAKANPEIAQNHLQVILQHGLGENGGDLIISKYTCVVLCQLVVSDKNSFLI